MLHSLRKYSALWPGHLPRIRLCWHGGRIFGWPKRLVDNSSRGTLRNSVCGRKRNNECLRHSKSDSFIGVCLSNYCISRIRAAFHKVKESVIKLVDLLGVAFSAIATGIGLMPIVLLPAAGETVDQLGRHYEYRHGRNDAFRRHRWILFDLSYPQHTSGNSCSDDHWSTGCRLHGVLCG